MLKNTAFNEQRENDSIRSFDDYLGPYNKNVGCINTYQSVITDSVTLVFVQSIQDRQIHITHSPKIKLNGYDTSSNNVQILTCS